MIGGMMTLPRIAYAAPTPSSSSTSLRLVNAHTGEIFDGRYRDDNGPIDEVMADLSTFLRDFRRDETINYDVGVVDFLAAIMEATGQTEAIILSAYRTRETNEMLRHTTFGVAENSQHIYGRALDIHFSSNLPEAMTAARAMQRGGVGWYPNSGFIHIDTGPVRNWNLDEAGLGSIFSNGRQSTPSDNKRSILIDARSGRPLPEFEHSGRFVPGMEKSGRLLE